MGKSSYDLSHSAATSEDPLHRIDSAVSIVDDSDGSAWIMDQRIRYTAITVGAAAWFAVVFFVAYYVSHPDKF